jgi:hypothetical protein
VTWLNSVATHPDVARELRKWTAIFRGHGRLIVIGSETVEHPLVAFDETGW